MSEFACNVVKIKIEPHPNADAIEIAKIGDFQSIVKKGQFKDGDLAIYIPEQAVVPEWLLRNMNLWDETKGKGGLAGSLGTRVKAIKLRGVLSQGLVYPMDYDKLDFPFDDEYYADDSDGEPSKELRLMNPEKLPHPNFEWYITGPDERKIWLGREGDDMSEYMGIVKYEPVIPATMRGRVIGADFNATAKYDFDNLKKTPYLFDDGEEVVITEKIHGTLLQVGVMPDSMFNEKYYKGRVIISSKGMGGNGYILDHDDTTNLYAQTAIKHDLLEQVLHALGPMANEFNMPVFLFGEVFGTTQGGGGVQDLTYTKEVLDYRAFDISVGSRGAGHYLSWSLFEWYVHAMGLQTVPLLYSGPYSKEKVLELTDGYTTLHTVGPRGHETPVHIREGVVVKSSNEAHHPRYGRKIAKSVSEAYLLRKGNTTEFQ